MNIVSFRERKPDECGISIVHIGGPSDGQEFRMVECTMDDGSIRWLWASDAHVGLFRQVFVPWDFEDATCIDA